MADQRCLSGAEKAGDDGRRNPRQPTDAGEVVHKAPVLVSAGALRWEALRLLRRTKIARHRLRPERPAGLSSIERQVSWLADRRRGPPSRRPSAPSGVSACDYPAYSCGDSCGWPLYRAAPTFPFTPLERDRCADE